MRRVALPVAAVFLAAALLPACEHAPDEQEVEFQLAVQDLKTFRGKVTPGSYDVTVDAIVGPADVNVSATFHTPKGAVVAFDWSVSHADAGNPIIGAEGSASAKGFLVAGGGQSNTLSIVVELKVPLGFIDDNMDFLNPPSFLGIVGPADVPLGTAIPVAATVIDNEGVVGVTAQLLSPNNTPLSKVVPLVEGQQGPENSQSFSGVVDGPNEAGTITLRLTALDGDGHASVENLTIIVGPAD